jgi:phage portal protein BeeE
VGHRDRSTRTIALEVSAVFACVKVISETMGTLPLIVYERVSEREKRRAYDTPEYQAAARTRRTRGRRPTSSRKILRHGRALHGYGYRVKILAPNGHRNRRDRPGAPDLVRVEKLPSTPLALLDPQPNGV